MKGLKISLKKSNLFLSRLVDNIETFRVFFKILFKICLKISYNNFKGEARDVNFFYIHVLLIFYFINHQRV